ncbi:MAG: DNA polymerase III subunit gamma/tau [Deltaproteobacteria bacterium]|nr:DNA polymerase III subunit gamma/tau [Deltaproteobacteria bacterium]
MSYLVFARKFRPQTFASLAGQEHISRALQNAILRNRVPHALLLTGPRGVGKTTSARLLAKALNCQNLKLSIENPETRKTEDIEPCGECDNCREIANASSLAVWEVDGASNNSVDHVRSLIESLHSAPPPGSRYKIYIIDEVHMLSTAAFNALLKSLEEPPANTIFIFATTEPHKIPETVISRCQRHDFGKLPSDVIISTLKQIAASEQMEVEEPVFSLISRKAQGGMRDAQSMFDRLVVASEDKIELATAKRVFGVVDSTFFETLAQSVLEHNSVACVDLINDVFQQSLDIRTFFNDFALFWRNLFLVKQVSTAKGFQAEAFARHLDISADECRQLHKLSQQAEAADIQRLCDLALTLADRAVLSNYPRFILESAVVKMALLSNLRSVAEIISSLEELKKKSPEGLVRAFSPVSAIPASAKNQTIDTPLPQEVSAEPVINNDFDEKEQFLPSGREFMEFVRQKSAMMVYSHLRRMSFEKFEQGVLTLAGKAFDTAAFKEKEGAKLLKDLLYAYSKLQDWQVNLIERDIVQKPAVSQEKRKGHGYVSGSLAAQDLNEKLMHEKQISNEAQEQEAVKSILSVFNGSKIEKVSVLKQ